MKVVELKICITDISDALTLGQNTIVSSIIDHAKDLVANGGVVTIERRYENADPVHLISYNTVQQIEAWKDRLNEVQETLGRAKVN
ncbi:hypothetical protein [Aeromonas jandaei]|uniref:hypothetical protein n=1 Tax=Aeromonas jandaei TaxID=650 RepID=UPI003B9E4E8C